MTTKTADELATSLMANEPVTATRYEIGAVSTSILEAGEGAPVVLLHGQGAFAEAWGKVITELARTQHVIAPDLPGLGRSAAPEGALTQAGVTSWLDGLIAKMCDQPPVLVGISLGGAIAARYAVAHPDRVDRIVLVDSGALGPFRPSPKVMFRLIRFARNPTAENRQKFASVMFRDPGVAGRFWGDKADLFGQYQIERARSESVGKANRSLLRAVGTRRIPDDQLAALPVPVSLIWGRHDNIMRHKIAVRASEQHGWSLHTLDAGHVCYVEQPAAFLDALRAALA